MKGQPEERAILLAQYMIETGATVRQTAAKFGVSKSTVHKDGGAIIRINIYFYENFLIFKFHDANIKSMHDNT